MKNKEKIFELFKDIKSLLTEVKHNNMKESLLSLEVHDPIIHSTVPLNEVKSFVENKETKEREEVILDPKKINIQFQREIIQQLINLRNENRIYYDSDKEDKFSLALKKELHKLNKEICGNNIKKYPVKDKEYFLKGPNSYSPPLD